MSMARLSSRGLAAGAGAFTIWGLLPLFLFPLRSVPSLQIIAHRIAWSCVFILAWMLWRGQLASLKPIFRQRALLGRLLLTALLISTNWLVYVWGVMNGHVLDTSFGYYINPLINVVLGIFVLHERLNRVQWVAVGIAALAVLFLTLEAGHLPWIALVLACSFSLYGLVRKMISVEALPGLATETILLMPLASAFLLWCEFHGTGAFGHAGPWITTLLVGSGIITAVPLFLFAMAARLLPYSTVGVLQYIGPSLQLLCGIVVFHEPFAGVRAIGFMLIWAALAIYALDGLRTARSAARAAQAA
ncbi:MAG: EamA family transporter RarD [Proteobacteria bacterium]|nr:EamA family transporter RarD [Pseudomonadota bacterium]